MVVILGLLMILIIGLLFCAEIQRAAVSLANKLLQAVGRLKTDGHVAYTVPVTEPANLFAPPQVTTVTMDSGSDGIAEPNFVRAFLIVLASMFVGFAMEVAVNSG